MCICSCVYTLYMNTYVPTLGLLYPIRVQQPTYLSTFYLWLDLWKLSLWAHKQRHTFYQYPMAELTIQVCTTASGYTVRLYPGLFLMPVRHPQVLGWSLWLHLSRPSRRCLGIVTQLAGGIFLHFVINCEQILENLPSTHMRHLK